MQEEKFAQHLEDSVSRIVKDTQTFFTNKLKQETIAMMGTLAQENRNLKQRLIMLTRENENLKKTGKSGTSAPTVVDDSVLKENKELKEKIESLLKENESIIKASPVVVSSEGSAPNKFIQLLIWSLIEGTLQSSKLLGLEDTVRFLWNNIPGDNWKEKMEFMEGKDSIHVVKTTDYGDILALKSCPLSDLKDIPGWTEQSKKLAEKFSRLPRSGGCLSPKCILHQMIRTIANAINIGCSSGDEIAIKEDNAKICGLTVEEARELIKDNACLYCLKK